MILSKSLSLNITIVSSGTPRAHFLICNEGFEVFKPYPGIESHFLFSKFTFQLIRMQWNI